MPLRRYTATMPRGDLFPEIGPFETGYLPLSGGHVMYWEQVGNPRGAPVLFLHGGPGAGAGAVHRRFFDPDFWRVVIFDQRGAGRSRPLGGLEDNTTDRSGRRYRDAAPAPRHRALAAVRRLLGLDAGAGLCPGASRPGGRLRAARRVPRPARRGGLVPARRRRGVPRRPCRLRRLPARSRARRHAGRLSAPADRPRSGGAHAGGARLVGL